MSSAGEQPAAAGTLAINLMHFARTLRRAGLRIGPGRIIAALKAIERIDMAHREEFYWALHAVFVHDHRQHHLFDQAFRLFWRDPGGLDAVMAALLPTIQAPGRKPAVSRRVHEALHPGSPKPRPSSQPDQAPQLQLDAAMTYSPEERLRHQDFAEMSADELRAAKQRIARMRLPIADVPTRRFRPDARGDRIDLRATLRASARAGAGTIPLRRRQRRTRPPTLVVLCDISGSMERYSRIFLHFLHGLTSDRDRVHSFLFGTRLTNVTRYLRYRDVDVALARVGQVVEDWSGGTRIGACIEQFNIHWSRRVLGQGAVVMLISDGLDRDVGIDLPQQMDRLHKSCRRLIWLNPLLRYDAFEPKARGIRAILPHVDEFRPVHNLVSLAQLADALSRSCP